MDSKKPPIQLAPKWEVISIRSSVWLEIEYEIGRIIPVEVRRAVSASTSIAALAADGISADRRRQCLLEVADECRRAIAPLTPSPSKPIDGIVAESGGRRPTSAQREYNFIGAVSGHVFRKAQKDEQLLRQAFRRPLGLFAAPMPIRGYKPELKTYLELRSGYRKSIETGGLQSEHDWVDILTQIAKEDSAMQPCRALRVARKVLLRLVDDLAKSPDSSLHSRDAYASFLWNLKEFGNRSGQIQLDGRPHEKISYGPRCGYLRALDVASRFLAAKYGWSVESGISFLLSDDPQTVKLARIDYRMDPNIPVLSRIVLTIDPTMSPSEVRALYSHARKQLVGRYRKLSDAQLALTTFVHTRAPTIDAFESTLDPEDVLPIDRRAVRDRWRQLMRLWNERPDSLSKRGNGGKPKTYNQVWRFRSQAKDALQRLLFPKYKTPQNSPEYPPLAIFEDPRDAPM